MELQQSCGAWLGIFCEDPYLHLTSNSIVGSPATSRSNRMHVTMEKIICMQVSIKINICMFVKTWIIVSFVCFYRIKIKINMYVQICKDM